MFDADVRRVETAASGLPLSTSSIAVRTLLLMNAGVWGVLGAVTLVRFGPFSMAVAALMAANAALMAWLGLRLRAGTRRVFYVALAVLALNVILTITDEFGLVDLVTLVFDLVIVVLLVVTRGRYLTVASPVQNGGR